jgi:hypothetical protein
VSEPTARYAVETVESLKDELRLVRADAAALSRRLDEALAREKARADAAAAAREWCSREADHFALLIAGPDAKPWNEVRDLLRSSFHALIRRLA